MNAKQALAASIVLSFATAQGWSASMNPTQVPLDAKRLSYAHEIIAKYGDKISPDAQRDMLSQRISLGIPPYESSLAAGAFTFHVEADPTVWPTNSDPYVVIQAQSLHPDKSRISLVFENATQFPARGLTKFRVEYVDGRSTSIAILAD